MKALTESLKEDNITNTDGFILADPDTLQTTILGIFAAGDCRVKQLRQVVPDTSGGSIVAQSAQCFIEMNFKQIIEF